MLRNTKGIGPRIGRLVALAVFAAVLMASLVLAVLQVSKDIGNRRKNLQNTSYVLAATVAEAVVSKNRTLAFESLAAVSRIPDVLVVALNDADGRTLANLGQTAVLKGEMARMDSGNLATLFKGVMPVAVDIVKGGNIVGRLILLADISEVRRDFLFTVLTTIVAAGMAALAGVLLSKPLQRRIVTPVTALTSQITKIKDSRNYSATLKVDRDIGEVSMLMESFDALMADIRFRDQSLQQLAYFDPLTGLPNHASLINEIEKLKSGINTASLAVFEIHKFRSLTNAFGQTFGDAILLSVAAAVRDAAGVASVFRTGAHEFAVLMPDANNYAHAEAIVAPVMAAFLKPLKIIKSEIKIDVDCGLVVVGESMQGERLEPTNVIRSAVLALNEARISGPNRMVCFQKAMKEKAKTESELGQDLRAAIGNRQLEAHYQPILDAKTGKISGFEALARWNHPKRGSIPPGVFVPIAEENGLIADLGEWILDESCKQAAYWHKHTRMPRSVSVNVSAAQFMDSNFAGVVADALTRNGLPAHLLCLEVTESIFIGSAMAEIRNTLQRLQEMGVMLALDDFGTGYSSLGYLAKLPLNMVKIDRSFVSMAHTAENRMAILKSIINMVHAIGLEAVAEGAETPEEIALLKRLSVDKIQGFGIARPMTAGLAVAHATQLETAAVARMLA